MKIVSITLSEITKQTGVANPLLYDFIVIADGSGTRLSTPCGWGGMIFHISKLEKEEFYGGFSGGTNNFAELMPFVFAMSKIEALNAKAKILFISDSEIVIKGGTGEYHKNANGVLWAAITSTSCSINWLHIPRNSTECHKLCDTISRELRFLLEDYERRV